MTKRIFKHLKSLGVTENVNTIFRLPTSYSARIKSFGGGKTLFPLACNYIACSTKWQLFESSVQCVVGWDCNFRRNMRLIWHNSSFAQTFRERLLFLQVSTGSWLVTAIYGLKGSFQSNIFFYSIIHGLISYCKLFIKTGRCEI